MNDELKPHDIGEFASDAQTQAVAAALRDAYAGSRMPEPSSELRDAVETELRNQKPQPAKERQMSNGKAKSTGVFVLTVSAAIVALVVSILWQWSSSQEQLADLGQAIGNVDASYTHEDVAGLTYGDDAPFSDAGSEHANSRCLVLGQVVTNEPLVGKQSSISGVDNYDVATNGSAPKPPGPTSRPTDLYGGTTVKYWVDESRGVGRVRDYARVGDGTTVALGGEVRFGIVDDDLIELPALGDAEPDAAEEFGLVMGPPEDRGRERYTRIYENNFKTTGDLPLSTFSIDVDTASYSKVRQYLQNGQLPPPDAVRIEELVNYFPYEYLPPMGADPFTAHMEVCECPWNAEHRLARIAIKGQVMEVEDRPHSNLVFLLDVSGSMNQANKLPLVKKGMKMLVERLGEKDRVAIVTYAGNAGLVLDSTTCDEKAAIMQAIDDLQPGGSTAGAAGMTLAYEIAGKHFIEKGVNRVLLCTDGDFNVGVSSDGGIVRLAEDQAKNNVFLSILGFGMDNLNDSMLEQVSGKANGMYAFIDTENEARKVLVEQLSGTLVTIAKDVKIQVEFNPAKVKGYRLIGYENRILAAEDFNDDTKDAGEIGAGHNVTALYEIVPADAKVEVEAADVDDLKYQKPSVLTDAADSDELLTLKLRYKQPDGETSTLISFPVDDDTQRFGEASDDFQFAAAVASFGMLLRGSRYAGDSTFDAVHEIASESLGDDPWGYRKEFVDLVAKAKELKK